jgi:hypothetical protein
VQGPLRLAVAVLVVGVLVVWLVKPIGNPCPDLDRLTQGSTATSAPSFSPPLTRTCTYTAALGIEARVRYVPWLDWLVIALIAAVAGGVARLVSPAGRRPREPRPAKEPPAARPGRPAKEPPAARPAKEPPAARPERPAKEPRAARPSKEPRAAAGGAERDAAERERARRERAERASRDR